MIRGQNNLDKAKKWCEKTECYLPGKSTQIHTEKSTQPHKHRKENSCPGNNYRTGPGGFVIL